MEPKETAETPAKIMVREIEELCKLKDKSAFREVGDSIRNFDWDTLWQELARKAPTLLHFYRQLFRGASKALICFAISMIIKWRSPKIVQRVISTVLYSNGANKQVNNILYIITNCKCFATLQLYHCLQPLMVSLSYNGMLKYMKSLTENFDSDVLKWSKNLEDNVQLCILLN